jgi:rhamnose utilization protein RhaD (predicted bifunctional aldolase and dehydrogenase)
MYQSSQVGSLSDRRSGPYSSDLITGGQDQLAELAALSARLGTDRRLVQGGGGNTSLKRDGTLWVKASGAWLAEAEERPIFLPLSLAQVRAALRNLESETELDLNAEISGLRPSIETSLHALLPHAVVLHVHSVNTIVRAVRKDAETDFAARLAGLRWAWIPYRRPGCPLTRAVDEVLRERGRCPDVLVLANHGLVVGGEDCVSAEALLCEVEHRLALPVRRPPQADIDRLHKVNDLGWRLAENDLVHAIGTDAITLAVASGGALYPDHAVFLGELAAVIDGGDSLSNVVAKFHAAGASPLYAAVAGGGVLLAPGISKGAEAMLECLAHVGLRLTDATSPRYLGAEDLAELAQWEAEAYRRAYDLCVAERVMRD